jgi:hypothetical protein
MISVRLGMPADIPKVRGGGLLDERSFVRRVALKGPYRDEPLFLALKVGTFPFP